MGRKKKQKRWKIKVNLEVITFFVISLVTITSAVFVIFAKEIFHSALYLAIMLLGISILFVMLNAEFIAVIQVLVYAGAIVVLMLFAIMLTKSRRRGTIEQ